MQKKLWSSIVLCAAVGGVTGYPLGNTVLGVIYGALIGTGVGLWLDRRIRPRPPVG